METKPEKIAHIKQMLNEKKLDYILLDQVIHTKWPSDDRPFMIREIEFDRENDRLYAYQRWDQEQTIFRVDEFSEYDVSLVDQEVERSIGKLKKYRVKLITYADLIATNPTNASKIVKYHRYEVEKKLLWFELDGEPEELS